MGISLRYKHPHPQDATTCKVCAIISAIKTSFNYICIKHLCQMNVFSLRCNNHRKRNKISHWQIDKVILLIKNLAYSKSLHESNGKESLADTSHPLFISNKRMQGGPKVTYRKKIKYLCYGSSKRAHFFTSNKGMFTFHIHKDKAREDLS